MFAKVRGYFERGREPPCTEAVAVDVVSVERLSTAGGAGVGRGHAEEGAEVALSGGVVAGDAVWHDIAGAGEQARESAAGDA